ncbi:killer cell lectin-like receptor subfamily B member 1B allele C [Acipenser oxyrinchus oxyrinchus]|uniref:Killer cell lectin-like receptor subfamily B member 1B allele C n=1 Tax=Acipenser oxyrinchus oxyrinchus TaxID=40147 RepID=A0AAD8D6D8_ACIOX|nr:killer cell lectin-like receptor subfamily B member 1B allele C [Acipenser oxyrinchus oxyrinchus]
MTEEVLYSDIVFSKTRVEGATVTNTTPAHRAVQPSFHSTATFALGAAVCVLLVIVIGMGIAITQIQASQSEDEKNAIGATTVKPSEWRNELRKNFCWDPESENEDDPCEICPKGWMWRYKGSCYNISKEKDSWDSSNNACPNKGDHLVVIENNTELEFLRSKITGNTFYWIGLKGKLSLGEWRWVDNTTFKETLFRFDNTNHKGLDCVSVSKQKVLADNCATQRPWICEMRAVTLN